MASKHENCTNGGTALMLHAIKLAPRARVLLWLCRSSTDISGQSTVKQVRAMMTSPLCHRVSVSHRNNDIEHDQQSLSSLGFRKSDQHSHPDRSQRTSYTSSVLLRVALVVWIKPRVGLLNAL